MGTETFLEIVVWSKIKTAACLSKNYGTDLEFLVKGHIRIEFETNELLHTFQCNILVPIFGIS